MKTLYTVYPKYGGATYWTYFKKNVVDVGPLMGPSVMKYHNEYADGFAYYYRTESLLDRYQCSLDTALALYAEEHGK